MPPAPSQFSVPEEANLLRDSENARFPSALRSLLTGEACTIRSTDVAVVVAHPDDESIGLGARLHRLNGAKFIHVTDGAPPDARDARARGFTTGQQYAAARHQEFQSAMRFARIRRLRWCGFGYSDQHATEHLEQLSRRLAGDWGREQVRVVFTHAYEGGHPDHDATAFAVHAAARLLAKSDNSTPVLVEMTFYHQGSDGIETGCFLGNAQTPQPEGESLVLRLSDEERRNKSELLALFATQRKTLQYINTDTEAFRIAPRYDFTQAPHLGTLFYEQFRWGMTGERFRQNAVKAIRNLKLARRPKFTCTF